MGERKSVIIEVYGREYSILSSEEPETTKEYASHIDFVMREIAEKTGSTDHNRVAMLALLQITHELYILKKQAGSDNEEYERRMKKLLGEIDAAIDSRGTQTELAPDD